MKGARRLAVLGLGVSGEAAAALALDRGHAVTLCDARAEAGRSPGVAELTGRGAGLHLGRLALPRQPLDLVVVSPGVPADHPWLAEAERRGIPALSELEWGWQHRRSRVVAVTGSNGKSTVVRWLGDALEASGRTAWVGGNYGTPVSALVRPAKAPDWLVLEVSSFQLETVTAFRAEVGVLLNCYPNHLDRHGDMARYLALKSRLFATCRSEDICILPAELEAEVRRQARGGRWTTFGTGPGVAYGLTDRGVRLPSGEEVVFTGTPFEAAPLRPNAAGGLAALLACGVAAGCARDSARALRGLPHRLEEVGRARGVVFIDDSKGTNLAAMAAAVRAVAPPVRLVAGGLAKEDGFGQVKEVLAERVASVYLIGRSAGVMQSAWSDVVTCRYCETLDRAVAEAWRDAREGECILLSPGCASFDQFENYGERGDQFARLAREHIKEEKRCAGS